MIHVTHKDWFLIDKKLKFWFTQPDPAYINLALEPGDDMRYDKLPYSLIDYPGEYDMGGIGIDCFLWKNNKLNYIIALDGKRVGIIQSPDVLELDEVGEVNFWLYQDDAIANKIDQLELEWQKQKLTTDAQ